MNLTQRAFLLFTAILFAGLFAACQQGGGEEGGKGQQTNGTAERPTASIAGQILVPTNVDAFGVTVFAEGTSHIAMTSSAGRFELAGLKPGEYIIRAMRTDLESLRIGSVTITEEDLSAPQPVGQFDPVEMQLADTAQSAGRPGNLGTITGIVTTTVEGDRQGVLVALGNSGQAALTDAAGRYRFSYVEPGNHVLTFIKSGFQENSVGVEVDPGADVNAPDVALQPATADDIGTIASATGGNRVIFGQVLMFTADGEPVSDFSNVRVSLEGTGFQATPDAAGRYELRGLQPRPYTIAANAPGYILEEKFRVDLAPVQNANIDLTLVEDTMDTFGLSGLYGRVELEDNPPEGPAGVQVGLAGEDFVTYTDDQGNWEIIGVEPGIYTVVATLSGYRDALVQGVEVLADAPTEVADIIMELDVEVPRVILTEPRDGARDVAINQPLPIIVQFSVPMDVGSVREAITLTPEADFKVTPRGQTHALSGTDLFTIEINAVPGRDRPALSYGTRYTLTIASSASSTEGIAMRDDYELRFTTDYALIIATVPEDGDEEARVLYGDPMEIYFNAPIDPESMDRDDIRIDPDLPALPNINWRRDPDTGWTKLNIMANFEFDTEYKVTIRRGAQTVTGDRVRNVPYTFRFKTRELLTIDEYYGTNENIRDDYDRERDRK